MEWDETEFEEGLDEWGEFREKLRSKSEKNMGTRVKSTENEGDSLVGSVVSEPEVIAAEILTNPKMLAVFLELGERPKAAKELVNAGRYVIKKVEGKYGTETKIVKLPLPTSTVYRILRKFVDTSLVRVYKGVDRRKKYYKLTEKGEKVLEKILQIIVDTLRKEGEKDEKRRGYRKLYYITFQKEVAKRFKVRPSLVMTLIGAEREGDIVYIKDKDKEEERSEVFGY